MTTPPESPAERLGRLSEDFAANLTALVQSTVSRSGSFIVTPFAGGDQPAAWIFPVGSVPTKTRPIPLDLAAGDDEPCPLWLRAMFQVDLNDSQQYLRVQTSVFGLCINPETNRCAIRIEYDRDKGSEPDGVPGDHRRAAAHVQIHGVSSEVAWAYGRLGKPPRPLEKLHIPVGGRRFRPSLEDFIEFLNGEELLPGIHPDWRDAVARHRGGWLEIQLRAAIANDPATAVDALKALGYQVARPRNRRP